MKFIAKSFLILSLLAVALGAIAYNLISSNAKQSGTINLVQQNLTTEARTVTNEVTQVDMNGPFDLVIQRADKASASIQGEERLLSRVQLQQEGKVLHITTKGVLVTMHQTLKVTLNLPALESLNQTGSGDSFVEGFTGAALSFNMNGSGDLVYSGQYQRVEIQNHGSGNMDLDLKNGERVDINSGGSGDMDVVGKANLFNVVMTGSGNVDAERLIALHTEATARGSGNLKVYASKELNVTATGSGDVEIYGNPVKKIINKSGSGEVNNY